MKKLLKKGLITMLFISIATRVDSAINYPCVQGIYYNFNKSAKTATVTYRWSEGGEVCSSNDYSGSVVIPESVDYNGETYSVTSIGVAAFNKSSGLTSVTIPNSVTSIGGGAFSGCTGLTSITIPESVTEIGDYAFEDCYFVYNSFVNNSSLSNSDTWWVTLCDKETKEGLLIKDGVAVRCRPWATTATIPNSVTSIGRLAFSDCTGLTSIIIPESVTSIGLLAFSDCTGLTSVTIGNSVTSIGYGAFLRCTGLTSVDIKNSMIGASMFSGCTGLTSVTIPDGVTSIGDKAFYNCTGLASIFIGNGVTSIGDYAFQNCTGLTSITIPKSVTGMGEGAFKDCSSLTSVTINSGIASAYWSRTNSMASFYFGSQVEHYEFGEGVKSIGKYACYGCVNLKSVVIHENVTSIGDYAFFGCKGLQYIFSLAEIAPSLGSAAFNSSAKIIAPVGCKSNYSSWGTVYEGFVMNCGGYELISANNVQLCYSLDKKMKEYVVPSRVSDKGTDYYVASIGEGAFYGCSGLTSVTIPERVISIDENAFEDCNSLSIFVNQGSTGLFALWTKGYTNVYDKETGQNLLPFGESTHTASSINTYLLYLKGPANITEQTLTLNGETVNTEKYNFTGLQPNTSYTATYTITVDDQYTYTGTTTIKTDALTLTTAQPKVINEGNIVVGAASNLDDAETNVGFQWRRTDWSDDFDSKTGGAYLYEGEMQGYIRNLNTNYLWKYRPFYTSDSGTTYYGDWKGIDPTDYSYFDPTVHTYAKTEIEGNAVQLKGYVQRGTDNVTNQGFVYWTTSPQTTSPQPSPKAREIKASAIPSGAQTVTATGTVMEASLTGLEYNTTYSYVAFVTTSEGETFYGEEQTFTTGEDPTGIETIHNSQFTIHNEGVYDLSGRKIVDNSKLKRGIYIVNGKKVLIR